MKKRKHQLQVITEGEKVRVAHYFINGGWLLLLSSNSLTPTGNQTLLKTNGNNALSST
ncbi:unnamed protein product, partial [Nesidiocoris tenuis]